MTDEEGLIRLMWRCDKTDEEGKIRLMRRV